MCCIDTVEEITMARNKFALTFLVCFTCFCIWYDLRMKIKNNEFQYKISITMFFDLYATDNPSKSNLILFTRCRNKTLLKQPELFGKMIFRSSEVMHLGVILGEKASLEKKISRATNTFKALDAPFHLPSIETRLEAMFIRTILDFFRKKYRQMNLFKPIQIGSEIPLFGAHIFEKKWPCNPCRS